MDNYIYVGKIINTFGIKGELKVISDFEYQDRIFIKDFPIYIGTLKNKEEIESKRNHKNYNLILFKGYNNINDVLKYKGNSIYILRSDLKLEDDEYLLNDIIGFSVYDNDVYLGVIIDYELINNIVYFKIKGDKTFLIPNITEYIKNIDLINKKICTNKGSELII